MKLILRWCFCGIIVTVLLGCSQHNIESQITVAEPVTPSLEQQVMLTQLNFLLSNKELKPDERFSVLYERASLYREFGLSYLAQQDYARMLKIRVDVPEVYNLLGVYFAQEKNFEMAIKSFDTALEIEPNMGLIFLNRGALLYYIGRYSSAYDDFNIYYELDHSDPYRLIWLYLAQSKIDKIKAKEQLRIAYNKVSSHETWAWQIIAFYLGEVSESQLMSQIQKQNNTKIQLAQALCEANFYLGEYYLSKGNTARATELFKLSMATNVYNFVEHIYARLELTKLHRSES